MKVDVGEVLISVSFSSALRRAVLESGRENRYDIPDDCRDALMPVLKCDCANRRLAALLIPYSGKGSVESLNSDDF